jgi:hypothetical protein
MRRLIACVLIATTAFAATVPPTSAHNIARVKRAIRKNWHGNDRKAIRVARCESSLNPDATSPTGKYLGLWQFDKTTWAEYDGPGEDPRDVGPGAQTKVAWRLFQDRGWQPWPTCGSQKAATADVTGPENTEKRR